MQRGIFKTLLSVLMLSSAVSAQVQLSDLESGYQNNSRRLSETPIQIQWRSSHELNEEYLKAIEPLPAVFESMSKTLEGAAKSFCDSMFNSFTETNVRAGFASRVNLDAFGQLVCNKNGVWIRNYNEDPGILPKEITQVFDDEFSSNVATFILPNDVEFSGILNFDGRSKRTHYSIMPFEEFKKTIAPFKLPIPWPRPEKLIEVSSFYADVLFSKAASEARQSANVDIQMDGDIAIVNIYELQNYSNSTGKGWIDGEYIYAEIETKKGFLPRILKRGRVAWHDGKLLDKLARSFAFEEIEFINVEFEQSGVFLPRSIKVTNNSSVLGTESAKRFIHEFEKYNLFLLNSDVEKIGKPVVYSVRQIDLVTQGVSSEMVDELLSLEEKDGIDRYYDCRTGTVSVNSSIEESIAIDLDRGRDELLSDSGEEVDQMPTKKTRTSMWAVWLGLGILAAFGLQWTRSQGAGQVQAQMVFWISGWRRPANMTMSW